MRGGTADRRQLLEGRVRRLDEGRQDDDFLLHGRRETGDIQAGENRRLRIVAQAARRGLRSAELPFLIHSFCQQIDRRTDNQEQGDDPMYQEERDLDFKCVRVGDRGVQPELQQFYPYERLDSVENND